jgi:hypothetical protein
LSKLGVVTAATRKGQNAAAWDACDMGDLRRWPSNEGSVNFHTIPFGEFRSSTQALKVPPGQRQ